jgi:hypothetical protein
MRSGRIVYHNNGRQDDRVTTLDGESTDSNLLNDLQLAKYVLMRFIDNQSVEKISEDFDNNVRFINGVNFLTDIRWIKEDPISGLYQITKMGRMKANASKSRFQ